MFYPKAIEKNSLSILSCNWSSSWSTLGEIAINCDEQNPTSVKRAQKQSSMVLKNKREHVNTPRHHTVKYVRMHYRDNVGRGERWKAKWTIVAFPYASNSLFGCCLCFSNGKRISKCWYFRRNLSYFVMLPMMKFELVRGKCFHLMTSSWVEMVVSTFPISNMGTLEAYVA